MSVDLLADCMRENRAWRVGGVSHQQSRASSETPHTSLMLCSLSCFQEYSLKSHTSEKQFSIQQPSQRSIACSCFFQLVSFFFKRDFGNWFVLSCIMDFQSGIEHILLLLLLSIILFLIGARFFFLPGYYAKLCFVFMYHMKMTIEGCR